MRVQRRIAMDPAGLDERGELMVAGPTETPQHAPGLVADPLHGNGTGLVPLSVHAPARASSAIPATLPPMRWTTGLRTWWQAADASCPQWLEVDLQGEFPVSSARTLFADAGLDYPGGITPGPYAYRIHGSRDGQAWDLLCDRARNNAEQHIVFDTWEPRLLRHVRLEITAVPAGMTAAVWEFTVFGLPQAAPARPSARSCATSNLSATSMHNLTKRATASRRSGGTCPVCGLVCDTTFSFGPQAERHRGVLAEIINAGGLVAPNVYPAMLDPNCRDPNWWKYPEDECIRLLRLVQERFRT